MKRIRKILAIIIFLIGVGTLLGGCAKRYTSEDKINFAQKKLADKYGEQFEVTEINYISGTTFNVYAYSVNHPDVIFDAHYNMAVSGYNEYEYDRYIEALVAEQYKELAEEQLEDVKYDYYIDSWLGMQDRDIPLTDTTITIEEYNAVSSQGNHTPNIKIFFTNKVLKENDDYIYDILKKISDGFNCNFGVFFLTEKDLTMVKTEYETCENLDGATVSYLERAYSWGNEWENGKHGYLTFQSEVLGKKTYEEFEKEMEVIRDDAGY